MHKKKSLKSQKMPQRTSQKIFPKIFRSRKGVSPLIATVLLIAFAVALGAVVMNWGRSYVEQTTSLAEDKSSIEISCSMDIRMNIIKVDGVSDICYNEDLETINFTIENTGTERIAGIRVQAIGNKSIVSHEINETFIQGLTLKKYFNYSSEGNGSIRQVRITPMITVNEKGEWCALNVLKVEEVDACYT
ncbi:archaellin/type IV pilin N-terminal domain-containing protein [Thermoproteota archaeon]